MNFAYFLRASKSGILKNHRTSMFQSHVFHGLGTYNKKEEDHRWPGPSASNNIRDVLHVWRSGVDVPDVFSPLPYCLVVSSPVRQALSGLRGLAFNGVEFEHVVDLPMPPLGTLPRPPYSESSESGLYDRQRMKDFLCGLPDVSELRPEADQYLQLLMGTLVEVDGDLSDVEDVAVNWGSYSDYEKEEVRFSLEMLKRYPIYHAGGSVFVFTEQAFHQLARFLSLDYYDIAAIDLRKHELQPWERPEELERNRKLREERGTE